MRRGSRSLFGHELHDYEIEVVPGLEEFVEEELEQLVHSGTDELVLMSRPRPGRVAIRYRGNPKRLNLLRSAVAVHIVEAFPFRHPRALLGHEHFARLLHVLRSAVSLEPGKGFATFRISAAGANSPTLVRLGAEIGQAIGLASVDSGGDLLVALRRPPDQSPGWQVVVRLSSRPLSARVWRECDLPGALNATVANVMVRMAHPRRDERFLNLACGSGTLIIERLALGPAELTVGNDTSDHALRCATTNVCASGYVRQVGLLKSDVGNLPLRSSSMDTLVVDLPYGMLVGTSEDVKKMYPSLVSEAARVAAPSASLVMITARTDFLQAVLNRQPRLWDPVRTLPLKIPFQSGYIGVHIFHVRRNTAQISEVASC
jgi:tRNA (guanine6-N2)-methyltransferase